MPLKRRPPKKSPTYRLVTIVVTVFILSAVTRAGLGFFSSSKSPGADGTRAVAHAQDEERYTVGIQAGHWEADELPEELVNLSWNFGASVGSVNEVDINLEVADRMAERLRDEGVTVDVLPATIPAGYEADAFVTIHADGNEDTTVSGFKMVASLWSPDDRAQRLADIMSDSYRQASGLPDGKFISDDMTEYYAFNFNKFEHAIHQDTPGVIVELGFITNSYDRNVLVTRTEKLARSLADGIMTYLNQEVEDEQK